KDLLQRCSGGHLRRLSDLPDSTRWRELGSCSDTSTGRSNNLVPAQLSNEGIVNERVGSRK
ncbi:unnamed protein product, partial [Nesidiocoris tenuis]